MIGAVYRSMGDPLGQADVPRAASKRATGRPARPSREGLRAAALVARVRGH